MLPRGLYTRVGKGPVEHKCRTDLALVVAKMDKTRMQAKKLQADPEFPDPTTCEPEAGYTVCTFTHPAADPESDPASISRWVFTGTDKEPIMIAYEVQQRIDTLAEQLASLRGYL